MPQALINISAFPQCPITTQTQPAQRDKGSPLGQRGQINLPPSEPCVRHQGELNNRQSPEHLSQVHYTGRSAQSPSRSLSFSFHILHSLPVPVTTVTSKALLGVVREVCPDLHHVPVVCELLQGGGVEAEGGEGGGREHAVIPSLLQGGQLIR